MPRGARTGELPGDASAPYSQAYFDVSGSAFFMTPSTYTSSVASMPPPPGASGMEKRVTRVFVSALVVNSTYSPVLSRWTALRPDASPAMSPMVRLGPTTVAPPPTVPSSASYMSYGMFAPRPTNSGCVEVLFSRLTGSSFASSATVTFSEYEPLAAFQVPRLTAGAVEPAAMTPECVPVRVLTVSPLESTSASVTGWPPPAESWVPWFLSATLNVTSSPAAGLDGEVVTAAATRSELWTGLTTSGSGRV